MMSDETKMMIRNAVVDRGLQKIISRKLLVWFIGTIGVPLGYVSGDQWIQLSMVYIGSQAASNFILSYLSAKNGGQGTQP
jgi:hypothetical protein